PGAARAGTAPAAISRNRRIPRFDAAREVRMRGFACTFGIAITIVCAAPARGALSIYLPVEDLAARAPLVVEGTVERTASGLDETTGAVATYTTLRVEYVHRGPADLARLTLREPGGRKGDLVNVVDAVPVFEPGERVFLFLSAARDGALRVEGMFF